MLYLIIKFFIFYLSIDLCQKIFSHNYDLVCHHFDFFHHNLLLFHTCDILGHNFNFYRNYDLIIKIS